MSAKELIVTGDNIIAILWRYIDVFDLRIDISIN